MLFHPQTSYLQQMCSPKSHISLSLSVCPYILWVYILRLCRFFYSIFLSFFGLDLPAFFSNHSPFLRDHFFVGFERISFSCVGVLSSIINSHSGLLFFFFLKSKMGFIMCALWCVQRHGTSCLKSHPRRLSNVQLIPYLRVLLQNKCQEWYSNLYTNDHKSNWPPLGYCTCRAHLMSQVTLIQSRPNVLKSLTAISWTLF